MYGVLALFLLIFSATPRQVVGGGSMEESLSTKNNLFFNSYEQGGLEEDELRNNEESMDELKGAVILQPDTVINIPPNSLERDYDMLDSSDYDMSKNMEYSDEMYSDSETSRGILQDIVSTFHEPGGSYLPDERNIHPFFYYIHPSLGPSMKENINASLREMATPTCTFPLSGGMMNSHIYFRGVPGCSTSVVGNHILLGVDCYDNFSVIYFILRLLKICHRIHPIPPRSSGQLRENCRSDVEGVGECADNSPSCTEWASSGKCHAYPELIARYCPKSCSICGKTCTDYSDKCETTDTLKDCLRDWNYKRIYCADTCGVCSNVTMPNCFDRLNDCKKLADQGKCRMDPEMMYKMCPRSCKFCKIEPCEDQRYDCKELKLLGGCRKVPGLMRKYCRKTCGFCISPLSSRGNSLGRLDCKPDREYIMQHCYWK